MLVELLLGVVLERQCHQDAVQLDGEQKQVGAGRSLVVVDAASEGRDRRRKRPAAGDWPVAEAGKSCDGCQDPGRIIKRQAAQVRIDGDRQQACFGESR